MFDESQLKKLPAFVAILLTAITFASAPFLRFLIRNQQREITRRVMIIQVLQVGWLLAANIASSLCVYGYAMEKLGYSLGVIATVLATAFGGVIAYGVFEYLFTSRMKIGQEIAQYLTKRIKSEE